MPCIYLTQQGAEVSRDGESLVVRAEGKTLQTIEIHHVESLCVFGRVHFTLPAMELLLYHNIQVAFLTMTGRLKGQLLPPRPPNVGVRLAQFRQCLDPAKRILWARAFVEAKLRNAAELVQRHAYNHPQTPFNGQAAEIKVMADRAAQEESLARLRGLEGAGTRIYFSALALMCRGQLPFAGRSSRPPRDPFNALLSFGYALLSKEISALLEAVGFEPYLGFYHEPEDHRPALALDLIEEFRHPVIDRFCLMLNNRQMIGIADFTGDQAKGFRLKSDALKKFLAEYDRFMRTSPREARPAPRQVIKRQIEGLVESLRHDRCYEPYCFES